MVRCKAPLGLARGIFQHVSEWAANDLNRAAQSGVNDPNQGMAL